MNRYTVSRTALVCEIYVIEARNEAELEEKLFNGNLPEPSHTEWLDWHGEWETDEVECLDPLYQMVKQHKETT